MEHGNISAFLHPLSVRYQRFATMEASERCPIYEELALAIAGQSGILAQIAQWPERAQQPNLVLAALRKICGGVPSPSQLDAIFAQRHDDLKRIVTTYRTQTNEIGRAAVLLPYLAALPQPLALVEIGASAGLCLLPDHFGYSYITAQSGRHDLPARSADAPVLSCRLSGEAAPPDALPQIIWRAGLDLNPLDPCNPLDREWLELLVWPSETARRDQLRAALDLAARDKPRVIQGDLHGPALEEICAQAPPEATLVIFHSAVLVYAAAPKDISRLHQKIEAIGARWISNETPALYDPSVDAKTAAARLAARAGGDFLVRLDGLPVGWADPHGRRLHGLGHGALA